MLPIATRLDSHPTDPLARIATSAELLEAGLSPAKLRTMLKRDWHRLHPGVIALGDAARQDLACRAHAAQLAIGVDATISHVTAGALICVPGMTGLPGTWTPDARIHLTLPRGRFVRAQSGVKIHRADLAKGERRRLGRIWVTSARRTVLDLALSLPTEPALVALEGALHKGLIVPTDLEVLEAGCRLRTGADDGRRALRLCRMGAESPFETLSRYRLTLLGLEPVEIQPRIFDASGRFVARSDMRFVRGSNSVLGEADGVEHHNGRQMRRDDSQREERLRLAGHEVVRWEWIDMLAGMSGVAVRINRFLDR